MNNGFTCNYKDNIQGVEWNDLYLDESGNIATNFDLNAIVENCEHALWLLLGEYDWNTTLGIDWKGYFDNPANNQWGLKISIKNNLLRINGVKSVKRVLILPNTRTRIASIECTIILDNGDLLKVAQQRSI